MKPKIVSESKIINDLIEYKSLKEIISTLTELEEKYPLNKLSLSAFMEYGDPIPELILSWKRPQTEEEVERDTRYEREAKERKRQQYEALKKEFEDV